MDTLAQIYARHSGPGKFNDKGTVHSYIDVYEELLAPYRETAQCVLEIGLYDGHSLRMWEEYFSHGISHARCHVYGIDCDEQPHGGKADLRPMIKEGNHLIRIIDATSREQFSQIFWPDIRWDFILEDGSHALEQQLAIYEIFRHHLSFGGLYCIEDIQDVDRDRGKFEALGFQILDRRHIKGRYDDVLAVLHKEKA